MSENDAKQRLSAESNQKAARRQQHRSARVKVGIDEWPIPVRSNRFIAYLIATTRLTEKQALNRRSCLAAAAKLLDDLAKLKR